MTADVIGAHSGLHSADGARPGEHPDRSANPVIKVADLAWLEFTKPSLSRAEAFAAAFGLTAVLRTEDELHLRASAAGGPCVLIRRGEHSTFGGAAFRAAEDADLHRIAAATGAPVEILPEGIGGRAVTLHDPNGTRVRVVAGVTDLPALPRQAPLPVNAGGRVARVNTAQRPAREPADVQRLGHVVVATTTYPETLRFYLEHFGLIVSDFQFMPGRRERGPVMAFIRCDRGATPTDHHTLALALGRRDGYVHSAYQVCDLDALAAGGEYLRESGYSHSWGIGRHVQGSQIFDYWRDPDGFMVEHFTDGDLFDATVEAGWSEFSTAGLAQWGPPATPDFLGDGAGPRR